MIISPRRSSALPMSAGAAIASRQTASVTACSLPYGTKASMAASSVALRAAVGAVFEQAPFRLAHSLPIVHTDDKNSGAGDGCGKWLVSRVDDQRGSCFGGRRRQLRPGRAGKAGSRQDCAFPRRLLERIAG